MNVTTRRYTLAGLKRLPTLSQGQFDNLKVDRDSYRVWLCRCGIADGMEYDHQVTVERYNGSRWETIDRYEAQ